MSRLRQIGATLKKFGFVPDETFVSWIALLRVRTAGEDRKGAIDLLGQHQPRKLVRIGHGAERKFLLLESKPIHVHLYTAYPR